MNYEKNLEFNIIKATLSNYCVLLLNKEKKVAVYCRSGRRSRTAAEQLTQKGFKVYNLNKGILHWKEKGKTIEK